MHKNKTIRFAESFIILPIISTISMPGAGSLIKPASVAINTPQVVSVQNQYLQGFDSIAVLDQALARKEQALDLEGQAIDAYFSERQMPLAGTGREMAEAAQNNGLDWRLLAAIAVRESSGGKHACKNASHSFFGWGSCKISFDSDDQAITALAENLSGNDPDTATHYQGKTTKEILQKYNSVIPHYAEQVMNIMEKIGPEDMSATLDTQVSFYAPSAQTA
ncbi:MAG TPA: glucosaminidase domain-containing protein [Candidatus Paceibacterota bacterium]|jgi:hypothetical protein|nr:glucosaminidase domain-containing protein [Candidatus Paceibacterota bacterium]